MTHNDDNNDDAADNSAAWVRSERDKAAVSARATLQGIVDHVFVAVAEQGRLSLDAGGFCVYSTLSKPSKSDDTQLVTALSDPSNKCVHCAAGHLLTDAELSMLVMTHTNTGSIGDVMQQLPSSRTQWLRDEYVDGMPMHMFVNLLQNAHDTLSADIATEGVPFRSLWINNFRQCVALINDVIALKHFGDVTDDVLINDDIVSSWMKHKQERGEW